MGDDLLCKENHPCFAKATQDTARIMRFKTPRQTGGMTDIFFYLDEK